MMDRTILEYIIQLNNGDDFVSVVDKLFDAVIEAGSCQCIALLQANGSDRSLKFITGRGRDIRVQKEGMEDKPFEIFGFLDNGNEIEDRTSIPQYETAFNLMKTDACVYLPVYIRDTLAMYVIAGMNTRQDAQNSLKTMHELVNVIQETAQQRNYEDSLRHSFDVLKNILDLVPSGIAVLDDRHKDVLLMNKTAASSESIQCAMGVALREYIESQKNVIEEIHQDTDDTWYDVEFNSIEWVDGRKVLLCATTDITQKKNNQLNIEYQANNDALTGLYNRRRLDKDLKVLLDTTLEQGTKGVLMFMDIDNFKYVNDNYGHESGDMLLQQFAEKMSASPYLEGNCYRLGGDEFIAIIRPEFYNHADEIIDELMSHFTGSFKILGRTCNCPVSMGLSVFPAAADNVEDLIRKTDSAMYEIKRNGKNGYRWYNPQNR